MTAYSVVTVTLEDRNDGGLRVSSDDLPGLILSGANKEQVCNRIAPAIQALLEHRGVRVASVYPSTALPEVLKKPTPRDLAMHIQHEMFVVVIANAAAQARHR